MPELPEVETLARDLRAAVVGRSIFEAWVAPDAPRLVQEMPVDAFTGGLRGRRIEETGRRGKFLLIGLSRQLGEERRRGRVAGDLKVAPTSTVDMWWIIHRRMSGNILRRPAGAPDEPYLRARFRLDDGTELRFLDLRKFGTMWLTDDPARVLTGLGPEPLDGAFTADVLRSVLRRRSAPVKAVLLDQAAIAGIGNLYADEALHYARIHPLRPADRLSKPQVAALRKGIVRALEQGLRNLGSSVGHEAGEEVSLRDHVNLSGEAGSNQEYLVAYGREGRPCRTCGTPAQRALLPEVPAEAEGPGNGLEDRDWGLESVGGRLPSSTILGAQERPGHEKLRDRCRHQALGGRRLPRRGACATGLLVRHRVSPNRRPRLGGHPRDRRDGDLGAAEARQAAPGEPQGRGSGRHLDAAHADCARPVKYGDLARRLRRLGAMPVEQRRRHEMWYNPATDLYTFVPRHRREVATGTLHKILDDLGISRDAFEGRRND
jgi:formamidopyrimidine-DNA glycosylase